ncbi:hypothetical protein FB446DRAFT_783309 [Lentinula raphanica]|nr:hypothetical protein FB446DRAFT_783309 [Lentinula raphanica]
MEFELVGESSDEAEVVEMSLSHINWFQDVEETYFSDESSSDVSMEDVFCSEDFVNMRLLSGNTTQFRNRDPESSQTEGRAAYSMGEALHRTVESAHAERNTCSESDVETLESDSNEECDSAEVETEDPVIPALYFADDDDSESDSQGYTPSFDSDETSELDSEDESWSRYNKLGLHPEWRDSSHLFYQLRDDYNPAVIRSIHNSGEMNSIFALKKEHLGFWKKELRGRGLHKELNNSHFGFRNDPQQRCFGDPVAEQLEYLLHKGAPYAGEDDADESFTDVERFCAVRVSNSEYVLLDSTLDDNDFIIPMRQLLDPDFRPVEWFNHVRECSKEPTLWVQEGRNRSMGDPRGKRVAQILNGSDEYPGRRLAYLSAEHYLFGETGELRFNCFTSESCPRHYVVVDSLLKLRWPLPMRLIDDPRFDVYRWYCKRLVALFRKCFAWDFWKEPSFLDQFLSLVNGEDLMGSQLGDKYLWCHLTCPLELQLNGVQIPSDQYPALQRNVARVRDPGRKVARPIVIVVQINGQPVTALLDSGSLGTFMSTTLIDQLKFKVETVTLPLTLQLAVQGSRSKINR